LSFGLLGTGSPSGSLLVSNTCRHNRENAERTTPGHATWEDLLGAMGGSTSGVGFCTEQRLCTDGVDCVCGECDDDLFCRDPNNCTDNGNCVAFVEGCVCADCADLPVCNR